MYSLAGQGWEAATPVIGAFLPSILPCEHMFFNKIPTRFKRICPKEKARGIFVLLALFFWLFVPTQFKIHILSHPNSTSLNWNLVLNLLNSKPFHVSFFLFSHPFSWFLHPSHSALSSRLFSLFLALRHIGLNRTKPILISFSLFKFSLFYKGFPAFYPFLISALPQVL